jgi:ABC-type transport system substrate-binding protein
MKASLFRSLVLALAAALSVGAPAAFAQDQVAPRKVLRYAFEKAETGFDPAQIADIYSRIVTAHIFEALYQYDHLARPYKIKPATAAGMPQMSDNHRTFVVRVKPGIYFADDPVFKGKPRELTAHDYVYSFKRLYDPAVKSPSVSNFDEQGVIGLRELKQEAERTKKPFDYEREVEGLKALDRYTLQFKLRESRPRFVTALANPDIWGAVAREVVEAYGDKIMEHPVGTGPFVLKDWRRSSLIVLERNPRFREVTYDAEPNADDAEGQALLARFKGRRLPMVDRVEVSIIEERQPLWLSFLNEEQDLLERLPNDYAGQAIPGGKLAPNLARRGIQKYRILSPDITLAVFNVEHPVVGGYTPEKVALRRAINLGLDTQREIDLVRHGEAVLAQSIVVPMTFGYRDDVRTGAADYDVARAKALLDMYGYADRDGDGWRELPDGSPLVLEMATQSDQVTRKLDELWKKNMDTLGLRLVFKTAQWPENLKAVRAGKFMLWRVASSAASPDGQGAMERAYGPSTGKSNLARIRLPAFDAVYERMMGMPDGPERQALFDEATKLLVAYAPYRIGVHRFHTDLAHPWVSGYRRPPYWLSWWHYVDVDAARQQAAMGRR